MAKQTVAKAAPAAATTAVQKKKKVSKKGKKQWRKYHENQDIEEHLAEVRKDELTGGPVYEKPDEVLFFVDKQAVPVEQQLVARRRRRTEQKTLHIDKVLESNPNIKVVGSHIKKTKKTVITTTKAKPIEKPQPPAPKKEEAYDVWNKPQEKKRDDEMIEKANGFIELYHKVSKKKPKTVAERVWVVENVETPLPGTSYNPSFVDHQELLRVAVEKEQKKIDDRERFAKMLQPPPGETLATKETIAKELLAGLVDDGEPQTEDEADPDAPLSIGKPTRAENRKTKQQRAKYLAQKEEERKHREAKLERQRLAEIYKLKSLSKRLAAEDLLREQRRREREEKKAKLAAMPKRLGKAKYEELDPEVQLTEELSGSLRKLQPEGNLFRSRFRMLEKRNMIEPRKLVRPHRKYAIKWVEKKDHREFMEKEKEKHGIK
eukprot:Colp12_sorted_trinity150504_noHs@24176